MAALVPRPAGGYCCASTSRGGPILADARASIRNLLHEAAELHHQVWRSTDGEDPDWASWYADWLTNHSELPGLLPRPPVRSELTWLLVDLDRRRTAAGDDVPWEDFYADGLIAHFAA